MASIAPPRSVLPSLAQARTRLGERWAMAAALLVAALFLFSGPAMPILLWDESRNIVNAMEMRGHGVSLITTYGGTPDLWNTKPPLLIWMMVASTDLFGPTLWALRLPSLVATLATLLVVMLFVRRVTESPATALLAAALFALSPALYGEHGARAADYDPLLVFFTTGYAASLFLALHAAPRRWLAPAVLALVGAVLTKSIAGVLPGIGIALYWLGGGRLPRLWRSPRYALAGGIAIAAIALFYLAREVAEPGYIAATWQNDVARRFHQSVIGAEQPATHYLSVLWAGYFGATPMLLVAPFGFAMSGRRARLLMLYAACVAGALIATFSLAASKLNHYILPALPFLAILAALTVRSLLLRASLAWRRGDHLVPLALVGVVAISLGVAAQRGIVYRYGAPVQSDFAARQAPYGDIIDRLAPLRRPIAILEPGFTLEGTPHYAAVLDGYRLLAAARGITVSHIVHPAAIHGGIVASCDPAAIAILRARGPDVAERPGCYATRWTPVNSSVTE